VGGDRYFKLGRQVDDSNGNKLTIHPKRGVVRSREPFKFWWAPTIFLELLKLE